MKPNLFSALFNYRPRDTITLGENFLTEAFAYILNTERDILKSFLEEIGVAEDPQSVEVHTQVKETISESDSVTPDISVRPDMKIVSGGKDLALCEIKWDAPCDIEQLKRYQKKASESESKIVFIGANLKQIIEARKQLRQDDKALSWGEIYHLIVKSYSKPQEKTDIPEQFADFLKEKGLVMKKIDLEVSRAFRKAIGFKEILFSFINKYTGELDSSQEYKQCSEGQALKLPEDKGKVSEDVRYGRLAWESDSWEPHLAIGFYCQKDSEDNDRMHSEDGIDLFLRIAVPDFHSRKQLHEQFRDRINFRKEGKNNEEKELSWEDFGKPDKHKDKNLIYEVRMYLDDVIKDMEDSDNQYKAIADVWTRWLCRVLCSKEQERNFYDNIQDLLKQNKEKQ